MKITRSKSNSSNNLLLFCLEEKEAKIMEKYPSLVSIIYKRVSASQFNNITNHSILADYCNKKYFDSIFM